MKFEQIMVSPTLAGEFLKMNVVGNRKLRKSLVHRYADAMTRGEWMATPEGIAFSVKGDLIDGQHRLNAVIRSGCTVPMIICREVPDGAFKAMNGGSPWTAADATKLPRTQVEVLTFILKSASASTMKPTAHQILELDQHIGSHIQALTAYCNSTVKTTSRASVRAAAVVQSILGNREYAFDLYRRLVLGEVEGLPHVAMAFVKQQLIGRLLPDAASGEVAQMCTFVKAMQVLSPKHKDRKRLLYTDELRTDAIRDLAHAVKAAGAIR
ncbi:MAG: hypothetical protein K2X55_29425 [Burkholderiaceae bacterium]|nr:hypothetical protein [Burkholderiaceae bacterium]